MQTEDRYRLRTTGQNSRFHGIATRLALTDEDKANLVHQYSNGRTTSSAGLYFGEMKQLLDFLFTGQGVNPDVLHKENQERCNTMRRKILAMCHTMAWYAKARDGSLIIHNSKPVLDFVRIDEFCKQRGPFHKPLQQHTIHELPLLVTVFQKLVKADLK